MASDLHPDKRASRWYFSPVAVIIAIFAVGPFAIPLVWMSPALKRWHKIAAILLIMLVTAWAIKLYIDLFKIVLKNMQSLQAVL